MLEQQKHPSSLQMKCRQLDCDVILSSSFRGKSNATRSEAADRRASHVISNAAHEHKNITAVLHQKKKKTATTMKQQGIKVLKSFLKKSFSNLVLLCSCSPLQ